MAIRFLQMNLKLFAWFTPFAWAVMLPSYGISSPPPPGISFPPPPVPSPIHPMHGPPPAAPGGEESRRTHWTINETFSLLHVPKDSDRYYAAVACIFLLTFIYFHLLSSEWIAFMRLREKWLLSHRMSAFSSLMRVSGSDSKQSSAARARISTALEFLFPGEVRALIPVYERRGGAKPLAPAAAAQAMRALAAAPSPSQAGGGNRRPTAASTVGSRRGHTFDSTSSHARFGAAGERRRGWRASSLASSSPLAPSPTFSHGEPCRGRSAPDRTDRTPAGAGARAMRLAPRVSVRYSPTPAGDERLERGAQLDSSAKRSEGPEAEPAVGDLEEDLAGENLAKPAVVAEEAGAAAAPTAWHELQGRASEISRPRRCPRTAADGEAVGTGPTRNAASAWGAWVIEQAGQLNAALMAALIRLCFPHDCSTSLYFIGVFNSRYAAAVATQTSLFSHDLPARAWPAPQEADLLWPTLRRGARCARALGVLAVVLTTAFFLLWNIPVNELMSLLTPESLGHVLGGLLSERQLEAASSFAMSGCLSLMQILTLYTGVLLTVGIIRILIFYSILLYYVNTVGVFFSILSKIRD